MNRLLINVFALLICSGVLLLYINSLFSRVFKKNVTCPNRHFLDKNFDVLNFSGFDNEVGTEDGRYIVPNYVHFLRFGLETFSFMDAVCVLAAYKNQKPDKIFIHTDGGEPRGEYWDAVTSASGIRDVLVFEKVILPDEIYGVKLNRGWREWHASDLTRIRILMKHGGIFLDNDSYLVRSLDDFRRYEMTLGWMENAYLANQVIIANRRARFLTEWLESYRAYDPTKWYYNAAEKPTKEVLEKRPHLIHREKYLLANHHITGKLYLENWTEWKSHYAIHLLYNHQYILHKNLSSSATYPVKFNENNIKHYPVTIKYMVYDVYPMTN